MIQSVIRGGETWLEAPQAEWEQLFDEKINKVVRAIERLSEKQKQTLVMPLNGWQTKKEIMSKMNIKSNDGFDAYRKREIAAGRLKMRKAGKGWQYQEIEPKTK